MISLGAVAAALALLAAFVPAGAATGDLPQLGPHVSVGTLQAGGTYIVRPATGAPIAAVELWYRAPSTGFGPKPIPSLSRLAAQVVIASKPLIGSSLGRLVSDLGGRLSVNAYSDSIDIGAVVPAAHAREVVKAMTTAFFAPVISDDGFHAAQQDVAQEAVFESFDPAAVVRDAVFAQLFSSGPQHYPVLSDAKQVATITPADVRAFATRAFRSQNAIFVASGAIDPSLAAAAVGGRPAAAGLAVPEAPATPDVASSPHPVSASFPEPSGGYGWAGPPIAQEREATAMDFIADYLFREESGVVSEAVADKFPDALLIGQFITLHDPGVMFVAYAGKSVDQVKAQVDAGLEMMRKPLEPRTFAHALAAFRFHLLSDLQTPSEMADNFGWYSVEGSPEYAPGANGDKGSYAKAADSLTADFVASVAQKYLSVTPVTVTLTPGKKSS
jgi:predicted Zn-dependent peptidase